FARLVIHCWMTAAVPVSMPTRRSLSPLPWRIVMSALSKSTSFGSRSSASWQRSPARQASTSSARLRTPDGARREHCASSISTSTVLRRSGSRRLPIRLPEAGCLFVAAAVRVEEVVAVPIERVPVGVADHAQVRREALLLVARVLVVEAAPEGAVGRLVRRIQNGSTSPFTREVIDRVVVGPVAVEHHALCLARRPQRTGEPSIGAAREYKCRHTEHGK